MNEEYREMKYQKSFATILLDTGKCFGYDYYILNLGTHPTAYVKVHSNHPFYNKFYGDIDIEVHGGLTYSEKELNILPKKENEWFLGWDYAHYNDYFEYEGNIPISLRTYGKKWTTEEIRADVYNVCKQLKEAYDRQQ